MLGRTYEPKRILRKKCRRPFPKEIVNDVDDGEDLFSALFASNIKEIKQKAKQSGNIKREQKAKKTARAQKLPSLSVVQELSEPSQSEDVGKENAECIFDELFRGPRYQPTTVGRRQTPVSPLEERTNIQCTKQTSSKKGRKPKAKTRVLRPHESQPNADDSYLDFLDESVEFCESLQARRKQLCEVGKHSKSSVLEKECEIAGNNTEQTIIITDTTIENKWQEKTIFIPDTPIKTLVPKEQSITSTPALQKFSDNYESCDISPIVSLVSDVMHFESNSDLERLRGCSLHSANKLTFLSPDRESPPSESDSLPLTPDIFSSIETDEVIASLIEKSIFDPKTQDCSPDPFAPEENSDLPGIIEDTVIDLCSKKGGRRYTLNMCTKVNCNRRKKSTREEKGSITCCERKRPPSSILAASRQSYSRRSHVVVPLEPSFYDGLQATLFRDVYLNSSILVGQESYSIPYDESIKELTFKDVVLQRCGQTEILDFSESFPDSCLINCKKIGEGVYGEVFSCQRCDGMSTVLKIMPIEGDCRINGEPQKSYEEILSEVVIAMELSSLRNGTEFCTPSYPQLIRCWCVQGLYPKRLLELWQEYHHAKQSLNDCPDVLPEDQVFIILELANVGTMLEGFSFSSAEQSYAVFLQVVYALAVAEAALEFEHRDLHWGNILLAPTKSRAVSCSLYGNQYVIQSKGIQASIIDFTLSRMTYDGCCIYNNLAEDQELFEGKGDYQFDIYRLMQKSVKNNWQLFEPYNNVLWLSYVLDKLITKSFYRSKTSKVHKKKMTTLKMLREKVLNYKSAREVAQLIQETV